MRHRGSFVALLSGWIMGLSLIPGCGDAQQDTAGPKKQESATNGESAPVERSGLPTASISTSAASE